MYTSWEVHILKMLSPQPNTKVTYHFQKCPYVLLCDCAVYVWKTWHEIYPLNVVESALYGIVNYSYPGLRIAGGFFTSWATTEAQEYWSG